MERDKNNPEDFIDNCIKYLQYADKNLKVRIEKTGVQEAREIKKEEDKSEEIYMSKNENTTAKEQMIIRDELEYSLLQEEWMNVSTIPDLDDKINKCKKCQLSNTRRNFVFGTGNPAAEVVVVGEAPGNDEDLQGKPFVGRAGQLLTDILKAINFSRDEVFICNILKCRPPGNRNPMPEEISKCEPYLFKQLEIIKPKLILALGAFAAQTLLKTKEPLGKLRGRFFDFRFADKKTQLFVTFHPAALLRNPNWKRPTWEDVKLFRSKYDEITKI